MHNQKKNNYISSRELRALEINAEYFGLSLIQLMELAGYSVAQEVISRFQDCKTVDIFCGLGGNGGDGFVAARHLLAAGFDVNVILMGRAKDIAHKSALKNYSILKSLQNKINIVEVVDSSIIPRFESKVIIDALLGTGTKGKLRSPIVQVVDYINTMSRYKIAIDIPTGIDSDTGEILGSAIKADLTVTFHRAKKGLEKAKKFAGKIIVKDIGLPQEMERYIGPGDVLLTSKARNLSSHKGDFGRLLVVGGSEVYSGAPALAALAAMRTGLDLVYLATPADNAYEISSISPDLIALKLEGKNISQDNIKALTSYLDMVDAVVMGPGMGLTFETQEFVRMFIEEIEKASKPLLLDADGLKVFAKFKRPLKVPLVLTPHAGEYSILTGETLPEDQEQRIAMIEKTADKLGAIFLVKGNVDVICGRGKTKLNFTGNPGMTVGGTGDVLSGIVGGFLAQNTDPFEAAAAGAFVNGAAGDFVAKDIGYHMVATDLIDWIPSILDDPMIHSQVRTESGS